MTKFISLAIYLIPVAAIVVFWVELVLTDGVRFAGFPIIIAVLTACLSWCIKDSAFAQMIRPSLLGCVVGSALAFLLLAPAIESQRVESELEELERNQPGLYHFTVHSTAIFPLTERHRRHSLKIAIPIGFAAGFVLGSVYSLIRKRFRPPVN